MVCIENENLKVWIKPKGAELKSLVNKKSGPEHIWDANPGYWGKSSPVLFPIVGGLKNNQYFFQGKGYDLPRHGFARDMVFQTESKTPYSVTFLLESNEDTLKVYPFHFEFRLKYVLEYNLLKVTYEVKNTSDSQMYFSVGGHPAFAVPFDGEGYERYYLEFPEDEMLMISTLSSDGLIEPNPIGMPLENKRLNLTKKLFYNDALVLKTLKSSTLFLKSEVSESSLKFDFEGFPYFGIWAAKDANFVCLEPWCGIADSVDHNQELTEKEGINQLASGALFERTWSVEVI